MKDYYFLMSSVTGAMKGEEILRKNGIRASVFRDSKYNPYGCGYVIKAAGEKEKSAEILRKSGLRINEIREER